MSLRLAPITNYNVEFEHKNNKRNLKNINFAQNPQLADSFEPTKTDNAKQEKNSKSKALYKILGSIAGGIAVVGTGIALGFVLSSKGKNPVNFKSLQRNIKTLSGNNNILDDVAKKACDMSDEIIKAGKEDYDKILKATKDLLKPIDKQFLPKDGIIYHGTDIKSAHNIVEKGVTPFVSGQHGKEFGSAFYTTPDSRVADFFGSTIADGFEGVVLPFKLKTDKIAHITEENIQDINQLWTAFYVKHAPNAKYFKEAGVELPSFAETLFAGLTPGKNVKFMQDIRSPFLNKLFKDAGYDAVFMEKAITCNTDPLFGKTITNALEKAKGVSQSQFAILDGTKVELVADKIREAQKLV